MKCGLLLIVIIQNMDDSSYSPEKCSVLCNTLCTSDFEWHALTCYHKIINDE